MYSRRRVNASSHFPSSSVHRKQRLHWLSATWDQEITRELSAPPSDMLSGLLLEDAVLYNAYRKVVNPPDKQLFMGFLAGIWVGLGGLTAISIAGGVPEQVRTEWISLPKLLLGAFFAFGKSSNTFKPTDFANIPSESVTFYCHVWW